jgi:hypothetical protein
MTTSSSSTDTTAAPAAVEPTLRDTLDCGAMEIINASGGKEQYDLHAELHQLMTAKSAAGEPGQALAVQLLMWCYSLRLDASNKTSPFAPGHIAIDGNGNATPDNLSPGQVQLLSELYPAITPAGRRARLADIVSLRIRKRRIDHAIAAIDAYMEPPLDAGHWHVGGQQHWHRALVLAISFHAGAGTRLHDIERQLFDAFEHAATTNAPSPLLYLRPLQAEEVVTHAKEIAPRLQQLADGRKLNHDPDGAAYVYAAAAYWYGRAEDEEQAARMLNERAAVTEARGDGVQSGMLRQHCYTDALRYYRQVDGRFHDTLKTRASIERVQGKLEAAGVAALGEMASIRIPNSDLDTGAMIKEAIGYVRDRSAVDALKAFCAIDGWPSRSDHLAQAKEVSKIGIMGSLMGITHLSKDGRQIEKVGPLTGDDDKDAAAMELKAIQQFIQFNVNLTAQMAIAPALQQIYMEHALSLADFQLIAAECPIVPLSHANAVAKGLYAGYQGDLTTALHLLVPQFENIVRAVLKSAGAITARTDTQGITMEVGLSTLIDDAKMVDTFGEDLTFGIRALMCSQVGPNYRNDIAHGLADSDSCNTLAGLYTWWFILKLVFTQWYEAAQPTAHGNPPGHDGDAAPAAQGPEK